MLRQEMLDHRTRHRAFVNEYGVDMPEISGWLWIPSSNQESAQA